MKKTKKSFSAKSFSKKNFGHFFVYYVISEAITLGLYIVIVLSLAPVLLGSFIQYHEDNAAYYVPGQDPLDIAIDIFFFLLFYAVLSVVYFYRDKERRLAYFKATITNNTLKRRIKYFMSEYGFADILYYFVVSIPVHIILGGTLESQILSWNMPVVLYHILSCLLFVIMYTCCVMIVTGIWEKNRPSYLTKGYEEKLNEI